ncbi:hypothetical protein DL96DRAFT_1689007, partial [Flagelloscypha sp. PMI_526]
MADQGASDSAIPGLRLPPELYPQILSSLPRSHLRLCRFANRTLRDIAEELLISHLVLRGRTWRPARNFLVKGRGIHLLKRIRTLIIELDELPIFREGERNFTDERLFSEFIVMIGPHLTTLCLDGQCDDDNGHEDTTHWRSLLPKFRKTLAKHVLPNLRSLELSELWGLPLLALLHYCPHLIRMHLGASLDLTARIREQTETNVESLPACRSISFAECWDFRHDAALNRYFQEVSQPPSFLHFEHDIGFYQPELDFRFLETFEHLKRQLVHLSLGEKVFDTAVRGKSNDQIISLLVFPQLRTLEFSVASMTSFSQWIPWSEWIASRFNLPHPSMETLRFTGIPCLDEPVEHLLELDSGAMALQAHIQLVFVADSALERFESSVESLRLALPSKNSKGNLSFWVGSSYNKHIISHPP